MYPRTVQDILTLPISRGNTRRLEKLAKKLIETYLRQERILKHSEEKRRHTEQGYDCQETRNQPRLESVLVPLQTGYGGFRQF